MQDDDVTNITPCYCRKCDSEFFKTYETDDGRYVVVCAACDEGQIAIEIAPEIAND